MEERTGQWPRPALQPFNANAQDAMANISSDSAKAVHSAVPNAERATRE